MNQINNNSQTQSSSDCERIFKVQGLESYQQALQNQLDPGHANILIRKLASELKTVKKSQFQSCFKVLVGFIQKGYASEILKYSGVIVRLMKEFTSLCSKIQSDPKAEAQVICILSAIAQLIREGRKFQFPFTSKFLKSVFLIDEQLLENSPHKDAILAILGVIYQCISRQVKLLKQLGLVKEFKTAVLTNYHLVSEGFSARLFNKSLYNLAIQGEQITEAELYKYKVFETVSKFIGAEQTEILISKMRAALNKVNVQQEKPKTQMIAEL